MGKRHTFFNKLVKAGGFNFVITQCMNALKSLIICKKKKDIWLLFTFGDRLR